MAIVFWRKQYNVNSSLSTFRHKYFYVRRSSREKNKYDEYVWKSHYKSLLDNEIIVPEVKWLPIW